MPSADFAIGLKCRLCGKLYPKSPSTSAPTTSARSKSLTTTTAVAPDLTRAKIETRPRNMWRYRELLPLDGEPTVGPQVGGTPLIRADRLADALGVERLWIKNDAVNFPTLSFKDRVVAVALSKAREFGFRTVGCASTGNLANSVAANAAAAGLESLHPHPGRPGAGEDPRHRDLRREGDRRQRHLRPGQPPLHADRLQVRLGLRERQPAAVLRRGLEDDGLRDRRGPRLAAPAARRLPDGRRQPDRQDPQGVHRTARDRPRRTRP